ncbi:MULTISPECIES: acyltransferase family protein [unclassified Herbaspirillum]|uniref:acyltransferase family protein n=1 Tax=unclassified Herbaspirillum TaxID=2624150 RepID=UPI00114D649A|nr:MULTISPECIES: acyltransferase family protein [unclassified Herbaspirillum]MBB5392879.1 peptidoglycan/LPS O-acetylase OafA/YrhL [Herbaspirillum sp. SJZ102]TQK04475.1 peptidoglycan/LPS O-acetylase OafA/YrhL [Herbaspirillum sp. SJZ130]TQK09740.1 peptidoglycan/LPS O-acetylase OafA/YrhL [Herbaspirillum sp. SJZ106]
MAIAKAHEHGTSLHPQYRPDIDGLRAIAVLSVLVFHAFPEVLPGGFIGVDIFFVISGFLISLIIFKNLEQGRFGIVEFYIRRIRRIFPALMTVMLLCIAGGWMLLYADEYKQLGKHLFGGSSFISNFLFWKESNYFDNAAETKPLLHLWSLAIEEQFYLFWPLLLAFVWRRKWGFLRIMGAIGLVSFAVNLYLVGHDQTAAFYSPLSRFWELMVGGALAYINLHRPQLNRIHRDLQSVLGLALLVIGFAAINNTRAFPGVWALLPTVGAFLILSAGPGAWCNRKLLASRVPVWFGLISYPLYLWHWPLLAFATIIEGATPNPALRLGAALAAIVLAWFTYRFIERPLRSANSLRPVWALAAANVAVGVVGLGIYFNGGFVQRPLNERLDFIAAGDVFLGSRNSDASCPKFNQSKILPEEVCLSNSATPRVMFVGDSHMMALHSAVYSHAVKASSIMVAGHSCYLYPNLPYKAGGAHDWGNNCTAIAQEALAVAARTPSIDTVVISNTYPRGDLAKASRYELAGKPLSQREAFLAGNASLIGQFQKMGKKVVYVMDVPHLKRDPHACVSRFDAAAERDCAYTPQENAALRAQYNDAVKALQASLPGLAVYDPTPVFCGDGKCMAKVQGKYLYNDNQHISVTASQMVLERMAQQGLLQLQQP